MQVSEKKFGQYRIRARENVEINIPICSIKVYWIHNYEPRIYDCFFVCKVMITFEIHIVYVCIIYVIFLFFDIFSECMKLTN